jgi:hypothetical protein
VKLLIYFDQLEDKVKRDLSSNALQANANGADDNNNPEDQREREMELICGGKEAEIEDQIQELNGIRDHALVQNGMIGQYLPMIVRIAERTLHRANSE